MQQDPAALQHVVFYASGHGFGHYVRVLAVAEALVRALPTVRAHLRTDGRALAKGAYLARLRTGGTTQVRKLVVVD